MINSRRIKNIPQWITLLYEYHCTFVSITSILLFITLVLFCMISIVLVPAAILLLLYVHEWMYATICINILLFTVFTYPVLYLYKFNFNFGYYTMYQYYNIVKDMENKWIVYENI